MQGRCLDCLVTWSIAQTLGIYTPYLYHDEATPSGQVIRHVIWLSNLPSTQNTPIASYQNAVDNVYVLLTRVVVSIQVAKNIYSLVYVVHMPIFNDASLYIHNICVVRSSIAWCIYICTRISPTAIIMNHHCRILRFLPSKLAKHIPLGIILVTKCYQVQYPGCKNSGHYFCLRSFPPVSSDEKIRLRLRPCALPSALYTNSCHPSLAPPECFSGDARPRDVASEDM